MHPRIVAAGEPEILFQSRDYVVVNKPAPVPCVDSEGTDNNVIALAGKMVNRCVSRVSSAHPRLCANACAVVYALSVGSAYVCT